MRPIRTHRVAVLELPGMMATSVALSHDVLASANRAALAQRRAAPFEVFSLRPGRARPRNLALLVVPGLGCASAAELQRALDAPQTPWALRTIRGAHASGVRISASCSGVFLLAAAGLLDGKRATTSWFFARELAMRFPAVRVDADRVLVESGGLLTGGAAMAHADVMLTAVEMLAGPAIADLCAKYLLLERRQTQRPFMVLSAQIESDDRLVAAEAWARRNIHRRVSIDEMARAVALGPRTFARRLHKACGLSPVHFLQRIRIDAAGRLIDSGASFEAAALEVGYSDATALRRVFRRHGRAGRSRSDGASRAGG